jgi:hypothetical protein
MEKHKPGATPENVKLLLPPRQVFPLAIEGLRLKSPRRKLSVPRLKPRSLAEPAIAGLECSKLDRPSGVLIEKLALSRSSGMPGGVW